MKLLTKSKSNLAMGRIVPMHSVAHVNKPNPLDHTLVIRENQVVHLVKHKSILYCQSDGNYTWIYLRNEEKIFASHNLKSIESQLPTRRFHRIHQSTLVNLDGIKQIGKNSIALEGGINLATSRRNRKALLEFIATC